MDNKKARNISTVLAGIGVILLVLPVFGVFGDRTDAAVLAALICFMAALFFREMVKSG